MREQAVAFARYARDVGPWLRAPRTPADCVGSLRRQLANRERAFLHTLQIGIYGNPRSPFRALLRHAGAEHGDVAALVEQRGSGRGSLPASRRRGEGLHRGGARAWSRSFAGACGWTFFPGTSTTPSSPRSYEARSGGLAVRGDAGRGRPRRHLQHGGLPAPVSRGLRRSVGARSASGTRCRRGSPGSTTLSRPTRSARRRERWFSQTQMSGRAVHASRPYSPPSRWPRAGLARQPDPAARAHPALEARTVAAWLAEKRGSGSPAALHATPSSAVRVCLAAERHGLDISGTFFRCGGEPYTPGKAAVVEAAGCARRATTTWPRRRASWASRAPSRPSRVTCTW